MSQFSWEWWKEQLIPQLTMNGTISPLGLQVSTMVPPRLSSAPITETTLEPILANVRVPPIGTKNTYVSSIEYTSRFGMPCIMTAAAIRRCMSSHLLSQSLGCRIRKGDRVGIRMTVERKHAWRDCEVSLCVCVGGIF